MPRTKKPETRFEQHVGDCLKLLGMLQAHLKQDFLEPRPVHWGHVNEAADLREKLVDIAVWLSGLDDEVMARRRLENYLRVRKKFLALRYVCRSEVWDQPGK